MKAALSAQKLRGGYYTPPTIARFLAQWAIPNAQTRVLEPSCGDGNLLEAAARVLLERGASSAALACQLNGVEYEASEAHKAQNRIDLLGLDGQKCVTQGDFFSTWVAPGGLLPCVDAVLGNPPFIRYQNFPEAHRAPAFAMMNAAGLRPNRLTNAWAPFLVASVLALSPQGRLAMVIPAELFQVSYAAEIRHFLADHLHRLSIITFRRLVFKGVQQEIVLLLGEKEASGAAGIRTLELEDDRELDTVCTSALTNSELKPLDHSKEKWTQYFLDGEEISLLRELRQHPKLAVSGSVLDVDVGVVTGNNSFFVLTESQIRERGLQAWVEPIVTRSNQLAGSVITPEDFTTNALKGASVYLLRPPDQDFASLPYDLQQYIQSGEVENAHGGYKCRIRKRWFIVPSVSAPDAFLLRQVHRFPKLILNEIAASSTDTVHRVRFLESGLQKWNVDREAVTAAFLNSLTFAFSEVMGRSYGGGVLTFEPSECEHLILPLLGANELDFSQIDMWLRAGQIESVLEMTDRVLLKEGLGLDKTEIRLVRGIWHKLRDRRIGRRYNKEKTLVLEFA